MTPVYCAIITTTNALYLWTTITKGNDMELRVLRYFLEVAHTGTLTAAAAKLNVTQPALSRQLKLLETELGVTLINREHNPFP